MTITFPEKSLWKYLHAFLYKQQLYKQRQAEIGKKSRKCQATPWGWTFTIWNYSHSSWTLLSKNNMAYSKNNQKNKGVSFHNIMWLIIMRMKMKKKNWSHRYGMDKPSSRQGHKYCKYKKCLNMMKVIRIEYYLSNIWSNISLITSYSFIPYWTAW